MSSYSRRDFLGDTSRIVAGAGLTTLPLTAAAAPKPSVAASDKIRVGLIGANSMGWANLREHVALPEIECVALCDIDQSVLDRRSAELEKMTGKKPVLYTDFRKLLENKDIDAVIIGTPDHWHCLQTVYACQAGKDVYVEKPMASSIEECNVMVQAAKKHNRVVQVGQWQRSGPHWQSAIEYVHSGKLGTISMVKNWLYYNSRKVIPPLPDEAAPQGVDYDMWLGPAPKKAYNKNRYHGSWRYFWDYGGGIMTDWGVHLIDFALYGMKSGMPKSVVATGGKLAFRDSGMQTPDTQMALYDFGDYAITWEHGMGVSAGLYGNNYCGVAFVGTNGTLVVDRDKWRLFPETDNGQFLIPAVPEQRGGSKDLALHVKNFVDCIKSRNKPACDVETARKVAIVSHLGNIALRTGRKVTYDESTNSFPGDKEATAFIKPAYREPWKFPKV
jgi:predicted dehydrogenase